MNRSPSPERQPGVSPEESPLSQYRSTATNKRPWPNAMAFPMGTRNTSGVVAGAPGRSSPSSSIVTRLPSSSTASQLKLRTGMMWLR